jgi:hypothetical protein
MKGNEKNMRQQEMKKEELMRQESMISCRECQKVNLDTTYEHDPKFCMDGPFRIMICNVSERP